MGSLSWGYTEELCDSELLDTPQTTVEGPGVMVGRAIRP